MRVTDMNWMQVEAYLQHDDRCVVPLGSTEQHAYLSLSVDSILSETVAAEAAEPLGVPVFPVVAYGLTPYFQAFPGTISLRMETYIHLVRDVLDSLYRSGFRRILLCNGHGGNAPAGAFLDGEFPLDPACEYPRAGNAEADDGSRTAAAARPRRRAALARRRQLRRPVSASRRGYAGDLGRGG